MVLIKVRVAYTRPTASIAAKGTLFNDTHFPLRSQLKLFTEIALQCFNSRPSF